MKYLMSIKMITVAHQLFHQRLFQLGSSLQVLWEDSVIKKIGTYFSELLLFLLLFLLLLLLFLLLLLSLSLLHVLLSAALLLLLAVLLRIKRFHWMKCILKCRLRNDCHFISASSMEMEVNETLNPYHLRSSHVGHSLQFYRIWLTSTTCINYARNEYENEG